MKLPRRRTALLAVPAAALALSLGACGAGHAVSHNASDESAYVDVGQMQYQVQISRQLNPRDVEDKSYFQGLTPAQRRISADQVWFGVFLRIENPSDHTQPTATDFQMYDTQGAVYRPIAYSRPNPLVYAPTRVVPGGTYPQAGSIAEDGPTEGRLLLFKVTLSSIENRPLVLEIHDPGAPFEVNRISLDV